MNGSTCRCGATLEQDQDGWYCPPCRSEPARCTCPAPPGHTWRPVDLGDALDGGSIDQAPVLLAREDGARLLYNGRLHSIAGESESLKTWLALLACATVINDAHVYHALFVDYEDSADSVARRLLALGCQRDAILSRFHYVRPSEPYGPPAAAVLAAAVPRTPAIVVIDGITEAMAAHGLDPLSNSDVAAFNARLPKPFAAAGCIVVMIDHVTKSREGRGRYAIGAQHKLSAVDGAAYTIELLKPFGHGLHGLAKIVIAKDRPGRVREHSPGNVAGMLHLDSRPDGSVLAEIRAAGSSPEQSDAGFRPTVLMQRVSEYVEQHPGLSGRSIVAAVKGRNEHKRLALELLIQEGYIVRERSGSAQLHKSDHPFRADENPQPDDA